MAKPFLDDSPMDGSLPSCTLQSFQTPRLRRCPHDFGSVSFVGDIDSKYRQLNGGIDGYNWKIRFEKGGPIFILKLVSCL